MKSDFSKTIRRVVIVACITIPLVWLVLCEHNAKIFTKDFYLYGVVEALLFRSRQKYAEDAKSKKIFLQMLAIIASAGLSAVIVAVLFVGLIFILACQSGYHG